MPPDQGSLSRLARATGDSSWYVDAALAAMRNGDRFSAAAWIRLALGGGGSLPDELLWDAGMAKELSKRIGNDADAGRLLLGGDAAWVSGDLALATKRWRQVLQLDPEGAWTAMANLSLVDDSADARLASAHRLAARFPSEPEALRYAAALMVGSGKIEEAMSLLPSLRKGQSSLAELLAIELDGRSGPEDRLVARVLRYAEARAGDPIAGMGAMRLLLERGRFEDFLILYDGAEVRGEDYPARSFFKMMAHVLRGEFEEARELAAGAPGTGDGLSASFAQGLTSLLSGRTAESLDAFDAARRLAASPRERSRVYKEIGRAQLALGRADLARVAWRSAADADPSDGEAVLLGAKN
jgi:tetratricopeptide (TPR) repeat protein